MWWAGHKWDHAGDVAVASMGYLYGGRDGGRKKSCTGISRFARVPHIVIQPLPPHTLILVACQCVGPWCRISVSHTPDTFGRDQQSNIKCWGCGGVWVPCNLIGAGFFPSTVRASARQLSCSLPGNASGGGNGCGCGCGCGGGRRHHGCACYYRR